MDQDDIYDYIEDHAHLRGNGHYIIGDDPIYHFEPGSTPVPRVLSITYHPDADQGTIKTEGYCKEFIDKLKCELGNFNPAVYYIPSSDKCQMEFSSFKTNYQLFADVLDKFLSKHRFFIPSLSSHQFSDEGNDEYSLSTKNGHLWIPGFVCHEASYDLLLATFDLNSFESYEKLKDHAQEMIRINRQLKENNFNAMFKPAPETIDLTIKVEAVSEDKIKADLEKIIEIVSG